ncbi:MAG: PfkB family carbohydrate kinase [Lachnospiraceae bacterium]|nr:PfkB family carbohydrate kinase [Lachnospiraceae bacterium]
MKKALIIGSTVADVIIEIDHLPTTEEDIHPHSQTVSLGGCAYNVSNMLRLFMVPYTLFSPVGTGIYGHFVKHALAEKGIISPLSVEEENGCCYCFVEATGNRTFLSVHGAEYRFQKEWFAELNADEISCVYVCGLELEEETGEHILAFLEAHPELPVFYAPGPRITSIPAERQSRLYNLHPIVHLNARECLKAASMTSDQEEEEELLPGNHLVARAAQALQKLTDNTVIVTCGKSGAYCLDKSGDNFEIPSFPATQRDGIGAGDSHVGSIIACLQRGMSLKLALRLANRVSAAVVETKGALLPDHVFYDLGLIEE